MKTAIKQHLTASAHSLCMAWVAVKASSKFKQWKSFISGIFKVSRSVNKDFRHIMYSKARE